MRVPAGPAARWCPARPLTPRMPRQGQQRSPLASWRTRVGRLRHHGSMDGAAVLDNSGMRHHELPKRGVNREEVDIGDESINAGIDAGWLRSVHIAARRDEIGQHLQIRQAARVGGVRAVAADALEMVALKIEFPRLLQACLRQARMMSASRNSGQNRSSCQREYDMTQYRSSSMRVTRCVMSRWAPVSPSSIVSRYLRMRWAMMLSLSPMVSVPSTM